MIQISERKFFAEKKKKERSVELKNSIYRQIDEIGLLDEFKSVTKKFLEIRNGFDHAWTGKGDKAIGKIGDFKKTANEAVEILERLIERLIENNIIK